VASRSTSEGKERKSAERLLGRKHVYVERHSSNATGSRHRPPNESPHLKIHPRGVVHVHQVMVKYKPSAHQSTQARPSATQDTNGHVLLVHHGMR